MLQEPLLLIAAWLFGLGSLWFAIAMCRALPWLPLFAAGTGCLLLRLALGLERHGLLHFLPSGLVPGEMLQRPLFELLADAVSHLAWLACNLLRVGMLLCMNMDEDERMEILEGMDPRFRISIFQVPTGRLLPPAIQRVLVGRRAGKRTARLSRSDVPRSDVPAQPRQVRAGSGESMETSMTAFRSSGRGSSLLDLVKDIEGVATNSNASSEISSMERIITQRMMVGGTVFGAKTLASVAQAQAMDTLKQANAVVSDITEEVKEAYEDPTVRNSAVGGAVALGAGGGATGLVGGGAIGAALGLVPAAFTFGLSIPVGAAIGSSIGAVAGSTVAGAAGFLGGGVLGYHNSKSNVIEGTEEGGAESTAGKSQGDGAGSPSKGEAAPEADLRRRRPEA